MLEDVTLPNSSRLQREQEFHNQRFADEDIREKKVGAFYQVAQSIKQKYGQFLLQHCKGARVIEYGCGTGSYAFSLAHNGATTVRGIDISPVAIELAQAQAQAEQLEHNLSFQVMNAEELKFDNSSIDLICGTGILHHLDIEKAMQSIVQVLHSQGKAVFIEPLGHNLFINLFRHLTPALRSEDEHPLLATDLANLKKYFYNVEIKYFYLVTLAAKPFIGVPGFNVLLNILELIDHQLLKLPFFQHQAWQVLITLSKPIK